MKIGKVSESVLKRSILKEIKTKREEVLIGAGVGEDCAILALKEDEVFIISTDPITGTTKDIGKLAVHITVNDLASSGAEPIGILLSVLLPERVRESHIKEMMQQVSMTCRELNIQIMGGHTEVTTAVNQAIITVTGVGKAKRDAYITTNGAKVGQDIVISKWVGLEGTSILAKEKQVELLTRFTNSFVEEAKELDQYISIVPEAVIATKLCVSAMHDITEGGVYGALWEVAESAGVGLEVDVKKIPIKQETIEVCEFFGINPYCLISSGSLIMVTEKGHDLVSELEKEGINSCVIGKITAGNDRILLNDGEKRYLEPPKTDELYKALA